MPDQVEKATLTAYGTPQKELEDLNIRPVLDSLTDEHSNRLNSAITDDYHVYPISSGLYSVESIDSGSVENTYTVNLRNSSACSCYDFLLRCTGSGMSCKHIWRVRFLIKLEALPHKDEDPFSWLISELYKDQEWLKKNNLENSRYHKEITDLEYTMTNKGRSDVNYKSIMDKRANILMKATRESLK